VLFNCLRAPRRAKVGGSGWIAHGPLARRALFWIDLRMDARMSHWGRKKNTAKTQMLGGDYIEGLSAMGVQSCFVHSIVSEAFVGSSSS